MSTKVKPPERPTAPICNATRIAMYDALHTAIQAQPELTSGAKTAGAIVAMLDVAAVTAFTGIGALVDNALINAWIQETLDSLGQMVHAAKASQPVSLA